MSELASLDKRLELTIMPTEGCNFRCTYCPQDHENRSMSRETIEGIKKLLAERVPDLESLNVMWFGGEPLVKFDVVAEIMEYVRQIANSGLLFTSSITTNGALLTKERLLRLSALGVKEYQITFDGDVEEHNKLRIDLVGAGTFYRIWQNIIAAHESDADFNITIRLHVNKNNEDSMKKMLRRIVSEIGLDDRFSVFIRHLARLGSKNDSVLPIIENQEPVERLVLLAKEMGLKISTPPEDYICYAAKPYAYVIRANGNLAKCTVEFEREQNKIGELLRDGSMNVNFEKSIVWSRGIFSGKKEELFCPANNFPKETARDSYKREEYKRKLKIL